MAKGDGSYILEICRGPAGCQNAIDAGSKIYDEITGIFQRLDFDALMRTGNEFSLKRHHTFIVSISFCPNACSRPQIADIGLIGAGHPAITEAPCSTCGACTETCMETGITLGGTTGPSIDGEKCLSCGKCIAACPTGTLAMGKKGFRALLGGRLGRHPRLGTDLEAIFSEKEILKVVENSLNLFIDNHKKIKRFADLFDMYGSGFIRNKILK